MRFAQEGARVFAVDKDMAAMTDTLALIKEFDGDVTPYTCDVTDSKAIQGLVAACLKRQRVQGDLKFIGLIGSKTKWATFQHRLEAKGFTTDELAFITCPIGMDGITGKEPEVIAVSVAAQLLQLR